MSDPATEQWRAAVGQSTSAKLRETQAALAASQADLTAALKDLAKLRQLLADPGRPDWVVARDGGRLCEICGGEIRRGEAHTTALGGAWGELVHVLCPELS
jgi:hypothetical protein